MKHSLQTGIVPPCMVRDKINETDMKRVHKASSDKLASMASRVLLDENSSKRAKSLAGSVLAQHEPHDVYKEKEKAH